MTENVVTNWMLVNFSATSLYSVIAGGNYHETNAGRAEWMSLINGASLQPNCNKEGFNIKFSGHNMKLRIGITGNNENDCNSCDSVTGFGFEISTWKLSSGNIQLYIAIRTLKTFGYIFVK